MKLIFAGVFVLAALADAQGLKRDVETERIFSAFHTHSPGCAVGVAQRGSTVFEAGYGMADLERNVTITRDTVFESGSVAKQFTAAAMLLLAQDGKLSLDDPMRKYLPELPDYGEPLTIRQVLSHISGLREWRPIATFGGRPEEAYVYRNLDILELAAKQKALNFHAGEFYSYSNTGFNLMPILIERVLGNGQSFESFTAERIFAPLGMVHTRWRDDFRAVIRQRALAYAKSGDEWRQDTPIENLIGAGGLLTTVGDLLLWNANFVSAKVGGSDFVKAQQIPAMLKDGRRISYAAGLEMGEFNGMAEVSHSGATGGYRTWLGRYPAVDLSVAVLCNSAETRPTDLGREVARVWMGNAVPKQETAKFAAEDQASALLAGAYRKLRDNTIVRVEWREGKLRFGNSVLTPMAENKFSMGDAAIEFQPGATMRMNLSTRNGDTPYERVKLIQPAAEELARYSGDYASDETGSTLKVAIDEKSGQLSYQIGWEARVVLKPTFRDAFETPGGDAFYFLRDAAGKVVGLSIGDDRVWDLRFKRVK